MTASASTLLFLVEGIIFCLTAYYFYKVLHIPQKSDDYADNGGGESWSSRIGLVLAMAGNAVGLGNFLRFPVSAIKNGGGAFIVPYLVCFLVMGIPLLYVEWATGRFGGKPYPDGRDGDHSTPFILQRMGGAGRVWKYVGALGIFINIAVAAYYCYVEAWTLSYVWYSITGKFVGQDQQTISHFFDEYVSLLSPGIVFVSWVFCVLLNSWVLSKGISGGIEKVARWVMPLLLLFGILLAITGVSLRASGHTGAVHDGTFGLNFLWEMPSDWSSIWKPKVWLAAAGQVFFTLSVGVGAIQCYASFIREREDIALNAMAAGWMNEFVEVIIGSAIVIPITIGFLGLDKVMVLVENGGFGLGFRSLPYLFQQWGNVLGAIAGFLWFSLLFFAGITSSLAMGMPVIGLLQDKFAWKRRDAAWLFGGIVFVLGLPTILFFNEGIFEEFDYWAGSVSLVIFALFEIVLFAWVFGMDKGWAEINEGADIKVHIIFKYLIQYVTPLFLIAIFIGNLPDWYDRLTNKEIYTQIAAAKDAYTSWKLEQHLIYVNVARGMLLSVFLVVCWLVRKANLKNV
jgi:neurotransmitter:Na+ symporter, NSS family